MKLEYRELTPKEQNRAANQKDMRTISEKVAYSLLPESMKKSVERNPPIAFKGCDAYFPDLFFREERICVEIDGSSHRRRKEYDSKRDEVFKERDFIVIRVDNLDTEVNVAFWQRLTEGLGPFVDSHPRVATFVRELRKMTDTEIRRWTDSTYSGEQFGMDSIIWQINHLAHMHNNIRVARKKYKEVTNK